jgi:hypothetical protein
MLLPGERLNAIRSNTIAKRQDIPLKQKRLELIIAFQKLGIDKYAFCNFLKHHIISEEQFLDQFGTSISPRELFKREKGLIDAKLMQVVLENF